MVIVETHGSGSFRVVDRETEMVRLGAGALSNGLLTAIAMRRAIAVLKTYSRLARIQKAEEIIAVSTSAIREARNGEDFLDRVRRETGIHPKAIPGEVEARLIYLAALHAVHLAGRRAMVVDMGGGSVEIALGLGPEPEVAVSEKLGVLRMTEEYLRGDPPRRDRIRRLSRHVQQVLKPTVKRIHKTGFHTVVGTSGTILALGRLALAAETGRKPEALHHATVRVDTLRSVVQGLARLSLSERQALPLLDRRRADIIVAGGVVLSTILDLVGAKKLVLCEWALREGILLDYMRHHRKTLTLARVVPDVRRRSVLELAERCNYDQAHARHVTQLAVTLFDGLHGIHGLGPKERDLLENASLLHDTGHLISREGHHRHSYYLIKNGGLRGFAPTEVEMIAILARYHSRGTPQKKDPAFAALPRRARTTVESLAAILRLADGLDRSHRQRVRSIAVSVRGGTIYVSCRAAGDAQLEMWGAGRRRDLMEKVFDAPVRVSLVKTRATAARRASATKKAAGEKRRSRPARAPMEPRGRKPAARRRTVSAHDKRRRSRP
jgi:exopolyphosphatase/guanosine-5'-triphosphate,3'-diphosphate pyrophosphatase